MSKKVLEEHKTKKSNGQKTSIKGEKKKKIAKKADEQKISLKGEKKKKIVKKTGEQKTSVKGEKKKKIAEKAGEQKTSIKGEKKKKIAEKAKDLQTPSEKSASNKNKKLSKSNQIKKSLNQKLNKKQNMVVKAKKGTVTRTKSKGFIVKLNHREKELQKLLEQENEERLILKDMEGRTYCAVENCDYPALVENYCRIHFFGLFKFIKKRKQILEQDVLTKSYISLVNKYSESVFEHLFKDLSSDKNFKLAVKKIVGEETDDLEPEEDFSDYT